MTIASCYSSFRGIETIKANAERIVTCVNAMEGLTNEEVINLRNNADQEKEKVAVAFAEWKDSNVRFVFHNKIKYNLRNSQNVFDNIPDLYKYFITNVYNK